MLHASLPASCFSGEWQSTHYNADALDVDFSASEWRVRSAGDGQARAPAPIQSSGERVGFYRVIQRAKDYLGGDAGAERNRRVWVTKLLMAWFFVYSSLRRVAWMISDGKRDPGERRSAGNMVLTAGNVVMLVFLPQENFHESLQKGKDVRLEDILGQRHSMRIMV